MQKMSEGSPGRIGEPGIRITSFPFGCSLPRCDSLSKFSRFSKQVQQVQHSFRLVRSQSGTLSLWSCPAGEEWEHGVQTYLSQSRTARRVDHASARGESNLGCRVPPTHPLSRPTLACPVYAYQNLVWKRFSPCPSKGFRDKASLARVLQ